MTRSHNFDLKAPKTSMAGQTFFNYQLWRNSDNNENSGDSRTLPGQVNTWCLESFGWAHLKI